MTSSPSRPLTYRPDIDGLRAVAVISVVAFHLSPLTLPGGFVGVDIFFVISGYLITGVIHSAIRRNSFSFLEFYGRRIRRIFPALVIVLLACLLFGWAALFADEYRRLGLHVAAGAGFLSNVLLLRESGYFDGAAKAKPLLHLWSLGVEEQFYLVWPSLMWAAGRRPGLVRPVIAVVIGLSFIANVCLVGRDPYAVFYLPFFRIWELAMGGLLAASSDVSAPSAAAGRSPRGLDREAASLIGCVLLVAAVSLTSEAHPYPGWRALLPTLGTALLIYAGPGAIANRALLSNRALVAVGLISYPLYLWHWPLLVFTRLTLGDRLPPSVGAAVILCSLTLAWATYRFVETKIRFGREETSRFPMAASLSTALAVIGLLGLGVYALDGIASRGERFRRLSDDQYWPSQTQPDYDRDALARSLFGSEFEPDRDFFWVPRNTARDGVTAVIGDSHANRIAVGLGAAGDDAGRIINIGRGSCVPLLDVDSSSKRGPDDCQPLMNKAISYAAKSPGVSNVVLAAFWIQYLDGRVGISSPDGSRPESASSLLRSSLSKTVGALTSAGKRVILVADVPEMDFPVSECLNRPLLKLLTERRDCSMRLAAHREQTKSIRDIFASLKAEHPRLEIVDPASLLCDRTACHAVISSGMGYFPDGQHLTYRGALYLGRWMRERLSLRTGPAPALSPEPDTNYNRLDQDQHSR